MKNSLFQAYRFTLLLTIISFSLSIFSIAYPDLINTVNPQQSKDINIGYTQRCVLDTNHQYNGVYIEQNVKDSRHKKHCDELALMKNAGRVGSLTKSCHSFPAVENPSDISNDAIVAELVLWQTSFFVTLIAVCLQVGILFVYIGMWISDDYFRERAWKIIGYFGWGSSISQCLSLLMVYTVLVGGIFFSNDDSNPVGKHRAVAVKFLTLGLGLTDDEKLALRFKVNRAWYLGIVSSAVMIVSVLVLDIVGYLNPPLLKYTIGEYMLLKDNDGEDSDDDYSEDSYAGTEDGESQYGGDYGSFRASSRKLGFNSITGYNGYNRYQNDEEYRQRAYSDYLKYTTYKPVSPNLIQSSEGANDNSEALANDESLDLTQGGSKNPQGIDDREVQNGQQFEGDHANDTMNNTNSDNVPISDSQIESAHSNTKDKRKHKYHGSHGYDLYLQQCRIKYGIDADGSK